MLWPFNCRGRRLLTKWRPLLRGGALSRLGGRAAEGELRAARAVPLPVPALYAGQPQPTVPDDREPREPPAQPPPGAPPAAAATIRPGRGGFCGAVGAPHHHPSWLTHPLHRLSHLSAEGAAVAGCPRSWALRPCLPSRPGLRDSVAPSSAARWASRFTWFLRKGSVQRLWTGIVPAAERRVVCYIHQRLCRETECCLCGNYGALSSWRCLTWWESQIHWGDERSNTTRLREK